MRLFHRRKEAERPRHEALSFAVIVAIALLLAWGIISFVFESYQVDGISMQNTLHNKDRLIVWKAPKTWASLTGGDYIPARGDIIIFKEPGLAAYGDPNAKQLIKRVIGLPGDHIVISNGHVTIYNSAHPNGFDPDTSLPYGKNMPGGVPYTSPNNYSSITLGKDQLFVMGDNRPDSLDSRVFGPINASQIVGQLVLRDWPISQVKIF